MHRSKLLAALLAALPAALSLAPAPAAGRPTLLESVNSAGTPGNEPSGALDVGPALSANARFIAFSSAADNLLADDTNHVADVFVRDLWTGEMVPISSPLYFLRRRISANCELPCVGFPNADGPSADPVMSSDGRFVAYDSDATNLVGGDSNSFTDVFVADTEVGATDLVSLGAAGQGNGRSSRAAISSDARSVAFQSDAANLVAGDTNASTDVFVRDRVSRTTVRVSVDSFGNEGTGASRRPSISADGRYVAFESDAANLVSGDTNGVSDAFVRDLGTGTTVRMSVDSSGAQANGPSATPEIAGDGSSVAFSSTADNLAPGDTNGVADVFLRVMGLATTLRVVGGGGAQPDGASTLPSLSRDGTRLAFRSLATILVASDANGVADVFFVDRVTGEIRIASVDSFGVQGNAASYAPRISADGHGIAFASDSSNLVDGDNNGKRDVFVALDETVCPDRGPADGPVSGTVYDHEDELPSGPERAVHTLNCDLLVSII